MSQHKHVAPKLVLYIAPSVTRPIPEHSSDNSFDQDGYEDELGGVRYDKVEVNVVMEANRSAGARFMRRSGTWGQYHWWCKLSGANRNWMRRQKKSQCTGCNNWRELS